MRLGQTIRNSLHLIFYHSVFLPSFTIHVDVQLTSKDLDVCPDVLSSYFHDTIVA
jgi:hypothetical protein